MKDGVLKDFISDSKNRRLLNVKYGNDRNLLRIAIDVCEGMIHLHSQNILHRDLTLMNILCEKFFESDGTESFNTKIFISHLTREIVQRKARERTLFHRDCMNRTAAEAKLKNATEGSFLFRSSERVKNSIIVSYIESGKIVHSAIKLESDKLVYKDKIYADLQAYVANYKDILIHPIYFDAPISVDDEEVSQCYQESGPAKVSVPWTAPEALETLKWNKKSDVWNYGVLLWELFSFGTKPSYCKNYKHQIEALKHGTRQKKPRKCSNEVWKVIQKCWELEPRKRPDFAQIKTELNLLLNVVLLYNSTQK